MKSAPLTFPRQPSPASWLLGHAPRTGWLAVMCLFSGVAAVAVVGWESWSTRQEARTVQDAGIAVQMQRGRLDLEAKHSGRPSLTVQQGRDWNQLARQLNTPWPTIFDALESTTPDSVALVAIEPDPHHGSVRLQVEAKTLDAALGYAVTLKTTASFQEVQLLKHETNEQDATRPVRLSLEVRFQPSRSEAGRQVKK
jgi:hypothetical protein